MRILRVLLLTITAVIVLAGVCAVVALDSRVQTWWVHRKLAGRPGSTVQQVAIGFAVSELRGVHLENNGVILDVPDVQAEFPPVAAYLNHRFLIRTLVAKGWTLDLRHARVAMAQGLPIASEDPRASLDDNIFSSLTGWAVDQARRVSPRRSFSLLSSAYGQEMPGPQVQQAFRGVFERLVLPFDLALADVELEGDVLVPAGPGVPPARIHVSVTGGGLGARTEGRFVFRVLATPSAPAAVSQVTAEGALSAVMDTPRTFTQLRMRLNATAMGPSLGQGVKLVADLGAARAREGESYNIVLSGETKPLLALLVDLPNDGSRLSGTWSLNVADEDLTPFLLGRELPNFDVAGQGQLDADPKGSDLHVTGGLRGTLDHLSAYRAALAPIGAVSVQAQFDLTRRGHLWRVDRLLSAVTGTEPIFTIQSLQPFAFDPSTGELQVANVTGDLFGIELLALPVTWLQIAAPRWVLTGGPLRGAFLGSARAGGVDVRSRGSLTVENLSIEADGRTLLENVNASVDGLADYAPEGWQVTIGAASLRAGQDVIADLAGKFGHRAALGEPFKVEATIHSHLPTLLAQAAFRTSALNQGNLTATVSATLGPTDAYQAKLALTQLSLASGAEAGRLPDIAGDLRVDVGRDGGIALSAPLTIDRDGRHSAVTLGGALGLGLTGLRFDGTLAGSHLELQDAPVLALPFVAAHLGGQLKVNVSQAVYRQLEVSDVLGTMAFSPTSIALRGASAQLAGGGPVAADLELDREPGDTALYLEKGAVKASDIDAAAMIARFAPGKVVPIDGKFAIDAHWSGEGATPGAAFAAADGVCLVSSKEGVFRLLSTAISPKSPGGNIALDALRSVASTVGNVISRHHSGFSNPAEAAIFAAKNLSEIRYDQLSLSLSRDAAGDLLLREVALISPEVRLQGEGHVDYQADTRFEDEPLSAQFGLRVRGRMAAALKYLDVLDTKTDDLGYQACTLPVVIKGTLNQPDTSELQAALLKIVADRGGDLLNRLLGK